MLNAAQDGRPDINCSYFYLLDKVSLSSLLEHGAEYNESASLTFFFSPAVLVVLRRLSRTTSLSFWTDFWTVMTTDCDLDLEVIQTLNPKV